MDTAGLDALLLTTEPEFRYFSGFLTQFWLSPTRPWFLVLPRTGSPTAIVPEIGAPLLRRTWVPTILTWPSPRPRDEGVSLLVEALSGLVPPSGRVGLPMGPETTVRMPMADLLTVQTALAPRELVDATAVVKSLRMVKSEAEIAKIRYICRTASGVFDAVPELVVGGQSLEDIFRAFKVDLLRAGADDVPYLVGASAPDGYESVIAPPDQRPLTAGDVLMLDTGATFDGYYCDFDRNFSVGPASAAAGLAYDTLFRATEVALERTEVGTTCSELYRTMRQVITDDGFASGNMGRMGHGLGMQLTEWPSHTVDDDTELRPGMVLTLEPSVTYGDGAGMVHEENVVVREHGLELLTGRAPERLPELRS